MASDALTILAVDESAAVQDLIEQALRAHGHRVLSTRDSREALAVAQRVRLDVLIVGRIAEQYCSLIDDLRSLQAEVPVIHLLADSQRPMSLDGLCSQVATFARDARNRTPDTNLASAEPDTHV